MDQAGATPPDTGFRTPLVGVPRNLPATYRSSATRATVALALVGLAVAAYGVQLLLQLSQRGLLAAAAAGTRTPPEAEASDARIMTVNQLTTLAYVGSGIGVLAWLWRVVGNVLILTSIAPRWSRNEAVGWWFVPLANWVMPYRVVRDTFHSLGAGASASLVTAWWACHVASSVVAWVILAGSSTSMDTLDGLRSIVLITSAMLAVQCTAGILLILVIRRMDGYARSWERGAITSAPPADWSQPGYAQPGYLQPGYAQPGYVQPGYAQPWSAQPEPAQPWPSQPVALQADPIEATAHPPTEDLAGETRRRESVVATGDGPLQPPPPPA